MLDSKVHRPVRVALIACGLVLLAIPSFGWMDQPPISFSQTVKPLVELDATVMPALDNQTLLTKARAQDGMAKPYQIAEPIRVSMSTGNSGTWEDLPDGSHLWRLRIQSRYAQHLNLAFTTFKLPDGAGLWIYDANGSQVNGPYTSTYVRGERLWTPMIYGDEIVVELHVPATASFEPVLELSAVNHGFRLLEKQGACNIDVACPERDGWEDQIRSEAMYSLCGINLCSGQMVNNTAQDGRPLFLTAAHCIEASFLTCPFDERPDSIVVYWNFESPTCGQLSGGSLDQNQSGSNMLAYDPGTDSLLFELDQKPDPAWNVYYTGWDASNKQPPSVVGVHHPSVDEKAISFENDPPNTVDVDDLPGSSGPLSWEVVWDQGTTEGGSSGSCIWDTSTGLCVGHLFGGFASCSNLTGPDYYGKLSESWNGSGTPATRLRDHFDPVGGGSTTVLAGYDPNGGGGGGGGGGGSCVSDDDTLCLRDGRFQVEVTWTDFEAMSGPGRVVDAGTIDSGLLWFFNPTNWEMLIKILDGCTINDRFWVFAAATTNVQYELRVTDTMTGEMKVYNNPLGISSPAITDNQAFATCP